MVEVKKVLMAPSLTKPMQSGNDLLVMNFRNEMVKVMIMWKNGKRLK